MMQRRLSRREFLKAGVRLAAYTSLVGVGGSGYALKVEPSWLDVTSILLTLPRLAPEFDNYKVAQITDIHMGDWTTAGRFSHVIDRVNAAQPDLVCITGDFVTRYMEGNAAALIPNLSRLQSRDGVVAVLGNHDHRGGATTVRQIVRDSGVSDLSNMNYTLERGRALLHVAGVDDVWVGASRLEDVLQSIPAEGTALLMAHEPDFADTSAATGRFDLQISGHSHGGQVVLPFMSPPRLPPLGRKYHTGLYRVGEMMQYTSRGVGMVRPYVRFNCRPEVTIFTLKSRLAL